MLHLSDSTLSFSAEFVSETNVFSFIFCLFVGTKKINIHIILNLSDSGSEV